MESRVGAILREARKPAQRSSSPRWKRRRGSAFATCARSRTRNGTCSPVASTHAASSAPTPRSWASTASGSPTTTARSVGGGERRSRPRVAARPASTATGRSPAGVASRLGRLDGGGWPAIVARGWRSRAARWAMTESGGGDADQSASVRRSQRQHRAQARGKRVAHRSLDAARSERRSLGLPARRRGNSLVNGQILEAGAEEGPFRSGSFTVSFGNGEVSMLIDGRGS